MNIPEKRCQCRFCGRVRIRGEWIRTELVADVVGTCKTCGEWQHAAHEHRLQQQLRKDRDRIRARIARGEPPREMTPSDWDSFKRGQ